MLYAYAGGGVVLGILIFFIVKNVANNQSKIKAKVSSLVKNKRYAEAIELQNRVVQKSANKIDEYLYLAQIYIEAKRYSEAKIICDNILKNKIPGGKSKEQKVKEILADILYLEGKGIESFKLAYEILSSNPSSVMANIILGKLYGSQGKFEKAVMHLKKAVELDPKNLDANYYLGIVYLDSDDLSNGIVMLDKAYNLDNTHLKTMYFLALACRQKGLNEKANMLFEKLQIKDASNLPEIVTNIGLLSQEISKFDITSLEIKLKESFGSNLSDSAKKTDSGNVAKNIDELINMGTEVFHNTAMKIVQKMGFVIKKDIRNKLIDPDVEIDLIVTAKKDEKQLPIFLQFTRGTGEIGTIPFADFIAKLKEAKVNTGVFITTSSFSPANIEKAKKEKHKIYLIDKNKLSRYI